jgi:hypothetical protein
MEILDGDVCVCVCVCDDDIAVKRGDVLFACLFIYG